MVKLAFDPADLLDISDPKEMPSYTVPEAAWSLRIPESTLRAWFFGNKGQFEPLLRPALATSRLLSFNNLVEAFTLRSLRTPPNSVAMQRLRRALSRVGELLKEQRPLLLESFRSDGARLFVETAGLTQDAVTGQIALFHEHLERIDFDHGSASRIYPFWLPEEVVNSPRSIVIDAMRSFGRPIVDRIGVPTEVINDRWWAGDSIGLLAKDFRCLEADIEEAIKYESKRRAA